MKNRPLVVSLRKRYRAALLSHLTRRRAGSLERAQGFGSQAVSVGLLTHDLSLLHESILVADVLPACPTKDRTSLIKQAAIFFAAAITPIERSPTVTHPATMHLQRFIEALSQRTVELASLNLELNLEIAQRRTVEEDLKKSELNSSNLLTKSNHLQEQLRRISRKIISAQEDERKAISRELHDVIAQTLTGINLRLAALKSEASHNTTGLHRNIALTQELVQKSVNIVHEFARELRPAALDDLGLIPALHSFMKGFTARTGVRTRLVAFPDIETLDIGRRTVLFRVTQEALTNVARHAKASLVTVRIVHLAGMVTLTVTDDGRSFNVQRVLQAKDSNRLGLLGMRERVEMVDGTLSVISAPEKGTTITANLPFQAAPGRKALRPTIPRKKAVRA